MGRCESKTRGRERGRGKPKACECKQQQIEQRLVDPSRWSSDSNMHARRIGATNFLELGWEVILCQLAWKPGPGSSDALGRHC